MKQRSNPTLQGIFEDLTLNIMSRINCVRVGKIVSFDNTDQTATVQLVDKRVVINGDGSQTLLEYPLLLKCPVVINAGSNGGLRISIQPDDTCIVLFSDRDIDKWWTDGNIQAPATPRMHNLTDGFVMLGPRNDLNKITDYDNEATQLNYLDAIVRLKTKIRIQNASQNLKGVLDNLTSATVSLANAVKALQVVDPISGPLPVTPGTISAVNNVITSLNNVTTSLSQLLE